jgi:hypothetical protein
MLLPDCTFMRLLLVTVIKRLMPHRSFNGGTISGTQKRVMRIGPPLLRKHHHGYYGIFVINAGLINLGRIRAGRKYGEAKSRFSTTIIKLA